MSKTIQPIAFKPAPARIAGPKVIKPAPAKGEVDTVAIGRFIAAREPREPQLVRTFRDGTALPGRRGLSLSNSRAA